jgi:hypothetical protein
LTGRGAVRLIWINAQFLSAELTFVANPPARSWAAQAPPAELGLNRGARAILWGAAPSNPVDGWALRRIKFLILPDLVGIATKMPSTHIDKFPINFCESKG